MNRALGHSPRFSSVGVLLAIFTGVVMIVAGVSALLAGAAVFVWIATLWITAVPPPVMAADRSEGVQLTTQAMSELIEHFGLPMFMLESARIVVANAAARDVMGEHSVGQDARVAFRHPAAVELLGRDSGGSALIEGLTGPRTLWQVICHPIDDRYRLIELMNRTAEADVSRAHTDFVANASHELRTPLASIIAFVETLIDEGDTIDPRQAHRFHSVMLGEARRLKDLVDDLMSLSRVEAEKGDQPRETIDLVSLVQRAAGDGAGPKRRERLELDVPGEELIVRGDVNQLEQLVRNLVDNAFKYGASDTPVTVSLKTGNRAWALLSVEDRGEGISAEHIPHLTRRFYRTDPSRSRAAGGTGLGLAIVKHIVERHRGRLDIASEVGRGTTVTVSLPIAE